MGVSEVKEVFTSRHRQSSSEYRIGFLVVGVYRTQGLSSEFVNLFEPYLETRNLKEYHKNTHNSVYYVNFTEVFYLSSLVYNHQQ